MALNLKEMLTNVQAHLETHPERIDEMLQQADGNRKEWTEHAEKWAGKSQNLFNTCANYANDFNAVYELLSNIKGGK